MDEKIISLLISYYDSKSELAFFSTVEDYLKENGVDEVTPEIQAIINEFQEDKPNERIINTVDWVMFFYEKKINPAIINKVVQKYKDGEVLTERELAVITSGSENESHKKFVERSFKRILENEPSWNKNIVKIKNSNESEDRTIQANASKVNFPNVVRGINGGIILDVEAEMYYLEDAPNKEEPPLILKENTKPKKKKYLEEIGRRNFTLSEEEFIDESSWDFFKRRGKVGNDTLHKTAKRYSKTKSLSKRELAIIKTNKPSYKKHIEKIFKKYGVREQPYQDDTTYYTLLEGGYLGEYFDFLPNGKIDKRVTGIGATHLELINDRSSIIVEPLKSIASMKAHKHDAIYVGSETFLHPKKITISEIQERIKESGDKPVKIISVADNLPKVIEAIGDKIAYANYFFMIDEIDTFQSDAGYREKLEKTIDLYFEFDNRCVISATLRDFSNPRLQKEPLTVYDYPEKKKKYFDLTITKPNNIDNLVAKDIKLIVGHGERVLIAYNSVVGILNIIEKLPDSLKEKCSILCSRNSKARAQDYYYEFKKGFKLETQISFMTSAYFSGIDLEEDYHLICAVNAHATTSILSLDRIKQILGRARNGTSSNHLICSVNEKYVSNDLSTSSLLLYSQKIIKSLECVEHVYSNDIPSLRLMNNIRSAVVDGAKIKGYKLVRKSFEDKKVRYAPAYFNIDALLAQEKTMNTLYTDTTNIKSEIEKHYHIDKLVHDFPDVVDDSSKSKLYEDLQTIRNVELGKILNLINSSEFKHNDLKKLIEEKKGYAKSLLSQYKKLIELLSRENAIRYLEELNKDKRDSRDFNFFYQALIFYALEDTHIFKSKMLEAFPIGSFQTRDDIFFKINAIHARADVGFMELSSHIQAVKKLNLYFDVGKTRKKNEFGQLLFKIKGLNPKNISIKKKLGSFQKNRAMFKGLSF